MIEYNLNQKWTFDNYIKGQTNKSAYEAASAIFDRNANLYNSLYIFGGEGVGKSHLLHAIAHKAINRYPNNKILLFTCEQFILQLSNATRKLSEAEFLRVCGSADMLLIDDIHFISGKETEQEKLISVFDDLYRSSKQIVIIGSNFLSDLMDMQERLISRFGCGLVVEIKPPHFEMRITILRRMIQEESVIIPEKVIDYLAGRFTTNVRELECALIRIIANARLIGKEVVSFDMIEFLGNK